MPNSSQRIEALAKEFVARLQDIAREELMHVLGGRGVRTVSRRAIGGEPGAKRPPAELEALMDKIMTFVKATPGKRIEQINASLGTSTAELALPMRKLIATRKIKTTGTRRATRYFPSGGGGDSKRSKKSKN
jgi:hypothetical protein